MVREHQLWDVRSIPNNSPAASARAARLVERNLSHEKIYSLLQF